MKGIQNLGNTCFYNSVLQILLNLNESFQFTRFDLWRDIYEAYWSNSDRNLSKYVRLLLILVRARDTCGNFPPNCQGDQHELLTFLLNIFHEQEAFEIKITGKIPRSQKNFYKCSQSGYNFAAKSDRYYRSTVYDNFTGQKEFKSTCTHCGHTSHSFETFKVLEIENKGTVLDSINAVIGSQKHPGMECDKCKQKYDGTRRCSFKRLPNVLFLCITSRFRFSGTRYVKDMTPIMIDKTLSFGNYQLHSIGEHFGSINGGHCTSVIAQPDGSLVRIDDSSIGTVLRTEQVRETAYLLCYVRESADEHTS